MPRAGSGPLAPLARDLPRSATVWLKAGFRRSVNATGCRRRIYAALLL